MHITFIIIANYYYFISLDILLYCTYKVASKVDSIGMPSRVIQEPVKMKSNRNFIINPRF